MGSIVDEVRLCSFQRIYGAVSCRCLQYANEGCERGHLSVSMCACILRLWVLFFYCVILVGWRLPLFLSICSQPCASCRICFISRILQFASFRIFPVLFSFFRHDLLLFFNIFFLVDFSSLYVFFFVIQFLYLAKDYFLLNTSFPFANSIKENFVRYRKILLTKIKKKYIIKKLNIKK